VAVNPIRLAGHAGAEIRSVVRAETHAHRRLRDRVLAIVFLTLAVDVVCGMLAFVFEHGAARSDIHSFGTALFWTTAQLLTVSSQMANPVTTAGRILDVFMEAWAITVVASLAGAFGAFLVGKSSTAPDHA
jgi:hypothetical protein